MNNHGQPTGPEFAMLAELHSLAGRVFGRRAESTTPEAKGRPVALAAVVVVALAAVVVRLWGF
jgi:hypothetical protein